jgi:thioredoxin-related protein
MPLVRRSVLAGLLAAPCAVAAGAGDGGQRALVMYRRRGCPWCAAWDRAVAPSYPRSDLGRLFPLVEVDLDREGDGGYDLARPVRYTPTFVLAEDGRELARIEGYPGEDFFWARLERLVEENLGRERAVAPAHGRRKGDISQKASGERT